MKKDFENLLNTVMISYDEEDTLMGNIPVIHHAKQVWMPFENWLTHHLGLPVDRTFFDDEDNPTFCLQEWDQDMHNKLIQYFADYRINAYAKFDDIGDFCGIELRCTLPQVW